MEEGTKNFLIGIIIGLIFLVVLLFPLKAIASLFFGRSAACIDDASKSSIDIMVSELDVLGDNVPSETPIKFGKGNCIFAILDKNANNLSGIAPPSADMINKNELCICEYDETKNSCTKNYYCRELSAPSVFLLGFDKKYISGKDYEIITIYYKKQGNVVTISKNKFEEETADVPISIEEDKEGVPQIETTTDYDIFIKEAHEKYPNVPESFIKSIIKQESGYNPNAVSYVGAAGLMQIMPDLAVSLGLYVPETYVNQDMNVQCWSNKRQTYYFDSNSRNPPRLISKCNRCYIQYQGYIYEKNCDSFKDERFNPEKAILAGTRHLSSLLNDPLVHGDFKLAAAAYNGGLGALKPSKSCFGQMIWECKVNLGYQQTRDYVIQVAQYKERYETEFA